MANVKFLSGSYAQYSSLAVKDNNTKSINNLCHYIVDGKRIIGKTNIERLFAFLIKYKNTILY